jgi:hypothetical protein
MIIEHRHSEEERDRILSKLREAGVRKFIDDSYEELKKQYNGVPFPDKSPKEMWEEELESVYRKAEEDRFISETLRLLANRYGLDKILVFNKVNNSFCFSEALDNMNDDTTSTLESFIINTPLEYKNGVTILRKE